MLSDLPNTPDGRADLRRRMTDAIVRHGSTAPSRVPVLQRTFTGPEIAFAIDDATAAARIILREPVGPNAAAALTAALARTITAFPDLAAEAAR